MIKLNLKIALRNLWKNKGITALNIGGLSIALAAFILVMIYVNFETTYDADNKEYHQIYKVGRNLADFKTYYTAPPLAKAIKAKLPEVEKVGNTKSMGWELPLSANNNRVYADNMLMMDYEVAQMFNVTPRGGLKEPEGAFPELYLLQSTFNQLFPNEEFGTGKLVTVGPKNAGQSGLIKGIIERNDSHSNITFDLLTIGKNIGFDEDYGSNGYNTWLQVKVGTDVEALTRKINTLYKSEMIAYGWDKGDQRLKGNLIFLDPLERVHLQPSVGSHTNYKIVVTLSVLSFVILIIACINFTNLSIAQANKRAKEVGIKKVLGAYYHDLVFQFLTEIFLQCLLSLLLGVMIAEMAVPLFNDLIAGQLSIWKSGTSLFYQLPVILLSISLIAGLYPALVLSGFKPAFVLKGNLQTSHINQWLRNSLLIGQFSVAVLFIIGLFIVSAQLKYMRTEDTGFNAQQVVNIRNIVFFNDPIKFDQIRQRMLRVKGVKHVTASTTIPDGTKGGTSTYNYRGKEELIRFIDVDFDYFQTLDIKLKEGRFFSRQFTADTAISAIVNESAVRKYGIDHPVGKTIKGCNINYRIVGVIKDYKMQGFEEVSEPTIYTIKNPCGPFRTKLMVKIEQQHMASALAMLKKDWANINKLDGEDFRYDFVDELYGKLFLKQEQLKSVFWMASTLTIFIALLGLFAFSVYQTNSRIKEISIRKILGASNLEILRLLNLGFVKMVILANLIACPAAYLLAKKWLETFAYRIDISS
ncbi:MAG: ABC transporter permease, partial [Bacteroidia bacterium]